MGYSPLAAVGITTVITALAIFFGSMNLEVDDHQIETHEIESKPYSVKIEHEFIGTGLKRDYTVKLNFNEALAKKNSDFNLKFQIPSSLILDVDRLNRLNTMAHYKTNATVDLESGIWAASSRPFTLLCQFKTNGKDQVQLIIPEMMARYHLFGLSSCFELEPPRISIGGIPDKDLEITYPKSLEQCIVTSQPSIIVPLITLILPFISCLLLTRQIMAVRQGGKIEFN